MSVASTYSVTGMTCAHCVSAVTEEIEKIPGITSVTIDLVPHQVSTVHVVSEEPIGAAQIADAVDEAGYEIIV